MTPHGRWSTTVGEFGVTAWRGSGGGALLASLRVINNSLSATSGVVPVTIGASLPLALIASVLLASPSVSHDRRITSPLGYAANTDSWPTAADLNYAVAVARIFSRSLSGQDRCGRLDVL